jgi:hypothetical protein
MQSAVALVYRQVTAQPPQFAVLLLTSISQPSDETPLQLPNPAAHAPTTHCPALHAGVAFGRVHRRAQLPQFCGSAPTFTSHPFSG